MRAPGSIHQSTPAIPSARPSFDAARQLRHGRSPEGQASLGLRARAFFTRVALDRQIFRGAPCEANDALTLRTRQLTDPRTQQAIARNLRGVIDYVDRHESRAVISTVVIEPRAVNDGREALTELAEQLERAGAVSPRGIILARRLLSDGLSPLFNLACKRTVSQAVAEIQHALDEFPAIGLDSLPAGSLN
jgi:hypothetical protein